MKIEFKSWHWPDHNIGKRESRRLRDEHNALYNSHAELIAELKDCITHDGAVAWRGAEEAGRRLEAISNIARKAIAKASEAPPASPEDPFKEQRHAELAETTKAVLG